MDTLPLSFSSSLSLSLIRALLLAQDNLLNSSFFSYPNLVSPEALKELWRWLMTVTDSDRSKYRITNTLKFKTKIIH